MSSSVQFDSGKTRMFSPLRCLPLYRFHSSGRWLRGSHWPNSSRKLNTRSFARAFSSSRRAPPNTAPNLFSRMPRSSVTVCSRLRGAPGYSSWTRPASMSSWTFATTSRSPYFSTTLVAELDDLVEVLAGVDVHHRERHRRRPECLHRQVQHHHGVLAAGEQQAGPLDGRGDLAEDVHRLGFQPVEIGHLVRDSHSGPFARRVLPLAHALLGACVRLP